MAIVVGDLLQITDFQEYLGEQVLNVYYYRFNLITGAGSEAYEELLGDFWTMVIGAAVNLQNTGLEHQTLQIKNLSNGVDFAEIPTGSFGMEPSTDATRLPSYVSMGFQLIRDSLVTRNGYKRYAGLVDGQVEGNEFVGDVGAVDDLEEALQGSLSLGVVEVAFPIIVKRPIPVPAGDDYLYSSVANVLFKGLGTQNTRKAGRGA